MKRKDYQKPLTEVVALDFDEVMCLPGASQIDNDGDGNPGSVLKPSCKPILLST